MIYGPITQKGAEFMYQIYVDALQLGSCDKEYARKMINFYSIYL